MSDTAACGEILTGYFSSKDVPRTTGRCIFCFVKDRRLLGPHFAYLCDSFDKKRMRNFRLFLQPSKFIFSSIYPCVIGILL